MGLMANIPDGEDLEEPFAIVGFAFLCNVIYTFGWITEINDRRGKTYGPKMFKKGLRITLIIIFIPLCIHFIIWTTKKLIAVISSVT